MRPAKDINYCHTEIDSDSDDLPDAMLCDDRIDSETDSDSDHKCRRISLTKKRTLLNFDSVSSINAWESNWMMHWCGVKNDESEKSTAADGSAKKRKKKII